MSMQGNIRIHAIGIFDIEKTVSQFPICALVDDPNESDVVFIWVNSPEELSELSDSVLRLSPNYTGLVFHASPGHFQELESLYYLSPNCTDYETPTEALRFLLTLCLLLDMLGASCESPVEKLFWDEARYKMPGIMPQREIGPYRLDFGIESVKVGIEIDGHDYHKTKEQRTKDAARERYIEAQGWRVIRFTGSEIYKDAKGCVDEAINLITSWVEDGISDGNT